LGTGDIPLNGKFEGKKSYNETLSRRYCPNKQVAPETEKQEKVAIIEENGG
jgi:hypothetical protein